MAGIGEPLTTHHLGPCANVSSSPSVGAGRTGGADLGAALLPAVPALREQPEHKGWDPTTLLHINQETYTDNNELDNDVDITLDEEEEEVEPVGVGGNLTGKNGVAERHVLPNPETETDQQCGGSTVADTALKNITLVNILIVVLLVVVIAANVNEGENERGMKRK